MPRPEIEQFAKVLITQVRDRAIQSCDSDLTTQSNGPIALRWRNKLNSGSSQELASEMVPDCIDETLFYLLNAIDSGALRLSFVATDGSVVDLTSEGLGELAGWYMGTEMWRAKYSKERFVDDFKDLK